MTTAATRQKTHCLRGHEIAVVGRYNNGTGSCKACVVGRHQRSVAKKQLTRTVNSSFLTCLIAQKFKCSNCKTLIGEPSRRALAIRDEQGQIITLICKPCYMQRYRRAHPYERLKATRERMLSSTHQPPSRAAIERATIRFLADRPGTVIEEVTLIAELSELVDPTTALDIISTLKDQGLIRPYRLLSVPALELTPALRTQEEAPGVGRTHTEG